MDNVNLVPPTVFCPKCGKEVGLSEMRDPQEVMRVIETGYSQGAIGDCECGVSMMLLTKKLPESPTFTVLFNVYQRVGRR